MAILGIVWGWPQPGQTVLSPAVWSAPSSRFWHALQVKRIMMASWG
jgi:hypothetical protein